MAENVNITPGTGDIVAADDIAGVKHQRVKISQGADGVATDVSSAAPLQVSLANTATNATAVKVDGSAFTQPVSGTVAANTGLAQPLTDTQLRATPVPVSGTITATVASTTITGTVAATQSGTWTVSLPTGAATSAKQPALGTAGTASTDVITIQGIASGTVIPISGAVINAGIFATQATTATQTANATLQNAVSATGNGTSFTVTGYGTALLQISGTFVATINFEASIDAGTTWTAISATQLGSDIVTSATTTGLYRITCTGIDLLRARVTWTSGTSVTVVGRATNATNASKLVKLATSSNVIGALSANQSVNNTQVSGTTIDVNSGNKSAGTQRVILATDQPSLTNAIPTSGLTASGSALTLAPITYGGRAATVLPSVVADGQVVNALFSKTGKQIVRHTLRETQVNQQTTITASTAETTICTANASFFLDLYSIIITNTSATATTVTIRDATAGTKRIVLQVPATQTVGFTLPACDGHTQSVLNNNWTATSSASVSSLEITTWAIRVS